MDKLHSYIGWIGRIHEFRDQIHERYKQAKEENPDNVIGLIKKLVQGDKENEDDADYSHIHRRKTRTELIKISAAVMGIEFSYAAETAFVSPTLLSIGVQHQHMTLVWALSPLVGFFCTPILGSLSDKCRLNMGRRRPFIILFSIGIFLGLNLVPNGENLGYLMGDPDPYEMNETISKPSILSHRSTASETQVIDVASTSHPWGILFTIIGTVLLDFDADGCQSPARAFLLDITLPEDHAKGLSTFTIMAGLGGFMGYSLGAIDWGDTAIGIMLGGHIPAVFKLVTVIFIICVTVTLVSFREVPLHILEVSGSYRGTATEREESEFIPIEKSTPNASYGAVSHENTEMTVNQKQNPFNRKLQPLIEQGQVAETTFIANTDNPMPPVAEEAPIASLDQYLMSIVLMPHSLRMVCLTNLFCWMAHVCYSLYFTDFVGEAVFFGDPKAPEGTDEYLRYEEGVRFGCWGMAMYSLSCACYSVIIEKLIRKFGAKRVYIGGLTFYSCGMCLMALTRAKSSVIIFSWCAGVLYSSLFTLPYLIIANYHSKGVFEVNAEGDELVGSQVRGLGTDVAIVSSMVFLAQFILSICMGTIVKWSGTTTAVVSMASFLSLCGALSATQIMYLDL